MTEADLETLRYPLGRFDPRDELSPGDRRELIDRIAAFPEAFRAALDDLDDDQLDTPYRPDGWTLRQVAHHVPDSHLNAYLRFKLAVTEDRPTIRTYEQDEWSTLSDARSLPVGPSLDLLDALHQRWTWWLRTLTEEQWARRFVHPEFGEMGLDTLLQLYAWHGHHHLAHVTGLREREGWG